MKEKEFIAKLKSKDDKLLFSYILDKYYQYKKRNISQSSNFLNDRELNLLENGLTYLNIPYKIYKPNEECERSVIYFGEYENFVTFYKITIKDIRHQDVLGSLFGCGFSIYSTRSKYYCPEVSSFRIDRRRLYHFERINQCRRESSEGKQQEHPQMAQEAFDWRKK